MLLFRFVYLPTVRYIHTATWAHSILFLIGLAGPFLSYTPITIPLDRPSMSIYVYTVEWVNMYQLYDFFHVFLSRQARLPHFRGSFKKSKRKLNYMKIELCWSSSKHNFTVPLENIPFLNHFISKILIFTFLQMCQKFAKT